MIKYTYLERFTPLLLLWDKKISLLRIYSNLPEKSVGYTYPFEQDEKQILAKDKAFDLMRDNFFDLWW